MNYCSTLDRAPPLHSSPCPLCIKWSKASPCDLDNYRDSMELKWETGFRHKVWEEAGYPSSGVLFNIKRCAKTGMLFVLSSGDKIIFYGANWHTVFQGEGDATISWTSIGLNAPTLLEFQLWIVLVVTATLLICGPLSKVVY